MTDANSEETSSLGFVGRGSSNVDSQNIPSSDALTTNGGLIGIGVSVAVVFALLCIAAALYAALYFSRRRRSKAEKTDDARMEPINGAGETEITSARVSNDDAGAQYVSIQKVLPTDGHEPDTVNYAEVDIDKYRGGEEHYENLADIVP